MDHQLRAIYPSQKKKKKNYVLYINDDGPRLNKKILKVYNTYL